MDLINLIEYYVNLLILQYKGLPKAEETIRTNAKQLTLDGLTYEVMNAYNIDNAVGKQLDVIGRIVGVKREGYGFDSYITLNDEEFRVLIKLAIVKNNTDSSLYSIDNLLFDTFGQDIEVFDYANMRMSYVLNSNIISKRVAQLFISQGLLPKPMGVGIGSTVFTPNPDIFYGFQRVNNLTYQNTPFNRIGNIHPTNRWLRIYDLIQSPVNDSGYLLIEDGGFLLQEDNGKLKR